MPLSSQLECEGEDMIAAGDAWLAAELPRIIDFANANAGVIFITWDDWGGGFDHVDPPNVEQWTDGTQFRYGSRVGCLVLSPYARSGCVSKVRHSHVSLLKFCVRQFGVVAPHKRVTAADDMSDCFASAPRPPRHRSPREPSFV